MILIGISGKKRTGKNTVAGIIKSLTNLSVKEFSFADELKKDVSRMCKTNIAAIETNKELYREMLQAWGMYKRKSVGSDYWIAQTFQNILNDESNIAIITDVRFRNEYEYIRKIGGLLVRVSRDTGLIDQHPSETELDSVHDFDGIILNTGTLEHLTEDVKEMMVKFNITVKK